MPNDDTLTAAKAALARKRISAEAHHWMRCVSALPPESPDVPEWPFDDEPQLPDGWHETQLWQIEFVKGAWWILATRVMVGGEWRYCRTDAQDCRVSTRHDPVLRMTWHRRVRTQRIDDVAVIVEVEGPSGERCTISPALPTELTADRFGSRVTDIMRQLEHPVYPACNRDDHHQNENSPEGYPPCISCHVDVIDACVEALRRHHQRELIGEIIAIEHPHPELLLAACVGYGDPSGTPVRVVDAHSGALLVALRVDVDGFRRALRGRITTLAEHITEDEIAEHDQRLHPMVH